MVAVSWPETPKSASLTSPLAVSKIFAAEVSESPHGIGTFDVSMKFAFSVQVFQSSEKFSG